MRNDGSWGSDGEEEGKGGVGLHHWLGRLRGEREEVVGGEKGC